MKVFSWPEVWKPLRLHHNRRAIARIAAYSTVTCLCGECTETTQLHAAAFLQRIGDIVQNDVRNTLEVPLVEVRIFGIHLLDQVGLDHSAIVSFMAILFRSGVEGRIIRLPNTKNVLPGAIFKMSSQDSPPCAGILASSTNDGALESGIKLDG